ncbi:hypothetical protein PCE1_004799 [Barthelona sp. PCE]
MFHRTDDFLSTGGSFDGLTSAEVIQVTDTHTFRPLESASIINVETSMEELFIPNVDGFDIVRLDYSDLENYESLSDRSFDEVSIEGFDGEKEKELNLEQRRERYEELPAELRTIPIGAIYMYYVVIIVLFCLSVYATSFSIKNYIVYIVPLDQPGDWIVPVADLLISIAILLCVAFLIFEFNTNLGQTHKFLVLGNARGRCSVSPAFYVH